MKTSDTTTKAPRRCPWTGKLETLEESLERQRRHKRVERFNKANFMGFPIAILG